MPWRSERSSFSAIYGMDPYANWVLNYAWDEFRPPGDEESDPFIPFVVALLSDDARDIIKASTQKHEPSDPRYLPIFIPKLNPTTFEVGSHFSAFARRKFFQDLAVLDEPLYVRFRKAGKRIKLGLPLKHNQQQDPKTTVGTGAELTHAVDLRPFGAEKNQVIIGLIDDGIAFANDRFRSDVLETRMAYFWQQDGRFESQIVSGQTVSSTVPYGREIAADAVPGPNGHPGINDLLQKHARAGVVDEDQVYADFGSIDFRDARDHKPVAQRWAHGTHVLDLAAGYPVSDKRQDWPIIAVQLPVATTADTSGSTLEVYVKHAINYINDRAQQLDPLGKTPLVINFSYGITAGPHDGTSLIEKDIENFLDAMNKDRAGRTVTFVLPAGNAQLSRDHVRICWNGDASDPIEDPALLPWRAQPNNLTTSHLEIWLPKSNGATADRIRIEIESPDGQSSGLLGEIPGDELVLYASDGQTVIAAAAYSHEAAPTDRGLFQISLRPTEHLRRSFVIADAPAGVWQVRVHKGPGYAGEDIEAWIQRDDTPFGYPIRARQSYFDEASYVRYHPISGRPLEEDDPQYLACHVKRVSLINAIATSCQPVVVGGVFRRELKMAEYSAGGPTLTICGSTPRVGPDVAAVSDDSRIHRGVLGAGSRSGSAFTLSGTSVAAPQIARFAGENASGRAGVIAEAVNEEAANTAWPPVSSRRDGYGRVILNSGRLPRID